MQAQKSLKKVKQSPVSWKKTDIPSFNPEQLNFDLSQQAISIESREDFLMMLLQYTVSSTQSHGAMLYRYDEKSALAGPQLLSKELMVNKPDIQAELASLVQKKGATKQSYDCTLGDYYCVLTPCFEQNINWVLINVFSKTQKFLSQKKIATQLLGSYVQLWSQGVLNKSLSENTFFSLAMVELLSEMQLIEDEQECFSYLVSQLQSVIRCDYVAYLKYKPKSRAFELVSLSGMSETDKRNNLSYQLAQCAAEMNAMGEDSILLESSDIQTQHRANAHVKTAELVNAKSIGSLILKHEESPNETVGGLVFIWKSASLQKAVLTRFLKTLSAPLSSTVYARESIQKRSQFLKKDNFFARNGKIVISGLVAFLLLMCFLPVNHKISSDLVVEPVEQRVISATQNGVIETINVKPGDTVKKGQILAVLEAKESQIRLEALQAEYSSALKKRSLQMAQSSATDTQIADLDVRQIALRMQLERKKLAELELTSPIDGVVVKDSFQHKVGTPVQQGKVMFEVAPLNKMRVELAIPASDISYVYAGQKSKILIDALSGESWHSELESIQPRSEIRNGENVFLGRLELANTEDFSLKPGMQGKGVISVSKRALGWVLFHKAFSKIKVWLVLLFTSPSQQ